MTQQHPEVELHVVGEPTLAATLTYAARATVPTRLYQLLHLAFLLAADLAYHGWWRPAAAAFAVAAFGAWGVADRWLWQSSAADSKGEWRRPVVRAGRAIAGGVAATVSSLLLLEAFLRILGKAPIS